MADESKDDKKDIGDVPATAVTTKEEKKKKKGIISRIWNGLFRIQGDDFEKRLKHISKEEASILARMKKRSLSWRRMIRHLIIFSVFFEVIAVGSAIMTTRSLDLDWKMRAFRVLPMFLLPALSFITYSALVRFTRMRDRKDQKTLERLRAERQAKIDELKERTNYYATQQLIQRYDPDPAAKAAAASVLASKLGSDSGLTMYLADESKTNPQTGNSNDIDFPQSSGLRKRKQSQHSRSSSTDSTVVRRSNEELLHRAVSEGAEVSKNNQLVVEHHRNSDSNAHDGGWIAQIAAMLVGEDPADSYALICGNCHMHNGLSRKEDFAYITYYCPHCNALNRPKQVEENTSSSISPNMNTSALVDDVNMNNNVSELSEKLSTSSSPVAAALPNGDALVAE